MNNTQRNYKKLKTMSDFRTLDAPLPVTASQPENPPSGTQMVLRMLVKPKYGAWAIPPELAWLSPIIHELAEVDRKLTGIVESWCYVTVRHGIPCTKTDDEWHFDGASFRVEIIPERNYVWVNHTATEYKTGSLEIPDDFDPCVHDLFSFASAQLAEAEVKTTPCKAWSLLNPFCLHRRSPNTPDESRTFIRIAFTDVEGRDVNNTANPLLPTPAYGRDPVRSFRNKLKKYAA
jgi:hypothetical protein